MKALDLINQTKVYQFIVGSKSRNTIDKLSEANKKKVDKLLKSVEKWMKDIDNTR